VSTWLINFRPQAAQAIRDGTRRQLIRAHRADGKRIELGDTVKLFTGLRTRGVQLLREATVTGAFSIRIDLAAGDVVIDGTRLDPYQRTDFAMADGFEHWPAMQAWLKAENPNCGGVFEGYLITWGTP